jgi:hypothetical protein
MATLPTYEQALGRFYTTGQTDWLDVLDANKPASPGIGMGSMVPPDLADPEIAKYVQQQSQQKAGLLPITTDMNGPMVVNPSLQTPSWAQKAVGMVSPWAATAMKAAPYIDPSAGLMGTIGRAAASPGEAAAGRLRLPLGVDRGYTSGDQPRPTEGALIPHAIREMGPNIWPFTPVRSTPHDQALEPVFDLAGIVMGGSLPAAEKGALGTAGGRLSPEAMDASRPPRLPVSEPGQSYQSLLDSFDAPQTVPVTNRDVTLGSGDTSGAGQVRSAALLGQRDRRTGLYSALERAVDAAPDQRAPGQQWLNTIANRPGVKPEELEWTGLRTFLEERRGQPVTKADIAQHLADNRVRLQESRRYDPEDAIGEDWDADVRSKYHDYQLPGGRGYRESILQLPEKGSAPTGRFVVHDGEGGSFRMAANTRAEADEILANMEGQSTRPMRVEPEMRPGAANYKSSHWDETNPLVHTRANDRVIDGRRSMHLEEIQSDWHQAGRKKGYGPPERGEVFEQPGGVWGVRWPDGSFSGGYNRGAAQQVANAGRGGVPDAPFKKNWHELALKRALVEAAEKGFERLSWTPGAAQAERYDLSKQIDNLRIWPDRDGKYYFEARKERRDLGLDKGKSYTPEQLEEIVGKDITKKAMDDIAAGKDVDYSGLDLKVGGEGMVGFYDKMVPAAVEKLAKQWGVKAQKGTVPGNAADWGGATDSIPPSRIYKADPEIRERFSTISDFVDHYNGLNTAERRKLIDKASKVGETPVWYIDIPEKMRADIKEKGFALFAGNENQRGVNAALAANRERVTGPAVKMGEQVFQDITHGTAASKAMQSVGKSIDDISGAGLEDGFVTSTGRFVSREEAMRIAQEADQVSDRTLRYKKPGQQSSLDTIDLETEKAIRGIEARDGKATAITAARQADAVSLGGPEYGAGRGLGGGGRSVEEAQASAARVAAGAKPVDGLPQKPLNIGGDWYVPGPDARIRGVAEQYMASRGGTYTPPQRYVPVDPERSTNIAKAFEEMKHAPDDPRVKASYDAMIDETVAQFNAMRDAGLKIEFIKPGQADPYALSPRQAAMDVADNNHLWVFPTDLGYGQVGMEAAAKGNPLLRDTGIVVDGRRLLGNDVFRIVHDYFGHLKEGHGFRAAGEDNAWRTHAAMYSDLARPAMTSETRGQNSWVNYGPHGSKNRTATSADTVYADQKIGLLPDWVWDDLDAAAPKRGDVTLGSGSRDRRGDVIGAISSTGKGYQDAIAAPAVKRPDAPLFDYSRLHEVPDVPQVDLPRNVPARGQPEHVTRIADPENVKRVDKFIDDGIKMGGREWYNVEPMRQEFVSLLGPQQGGKDFNLFTDLIAATSPRSNVKTNVRNASNYYKMIKSGEEYPQPMRVGNNWTLDGPMEEPFGHIAQGLHGLNVKNILEGTWDPLQNPKPLSFSANIAGNQRPVTIDTHNVRMWGLRDKQGREVDSPKGAYGFMEPLQQELAAKKGLSPAQYQASGWIGAGGETGLASSADPLLRVFENLIGKQAETMGITKEEVLKRFIRGETKLGTRNRGTTLGSGDTSGTGQARTAALLGSTSDQPGITAYHGSPHDFDRFDMSKIGTGEGAQIYGHGLYFAGAEKTAKHYRDILSRGNGYSNVEFNGKTFERGTPEWKMLSTIKTDGIGVARKLMKDYESDAAAGKDYIREMGGDDFIRRARAVVDAAPGKRAITRNDGRLYEVGIDAEPEMLLQFEKPYAQQPDYVQRAVKDHVMDVAKRQKAAAAKLLEKYPKGRPSASPLGRHQAITDLENWQKLVTQEIEEIAAGKSGKAIYESAGQPAVDRETGYPKSTAALLDRGIPGLRYLDAGSRPHIYQGPLGDYFVEFPGIEKRYGPFKTEQRAISEADKRATHNYVIFDDRLIKILRKYGIAVPGAAAAAGGMGSLAPEEM